MVTSVGWDPDKPAERVNDHFLFSRGTSNANVVTSDDGDVVINTGTPYQGVRNRERFEQLLGRPLKVRKIILSQYHADHVGGWEAFADPDVETYVHANFNRLNDEWQALSPYYQPRGARFLMGMMPDPKHLQSFYGTRREPEDIIIVDEETSFEIGGRRFEIFSIPSGETTDSLAVWLPEERTLFCGNFMGALYGALPNFYTIRGDRQRSVPAFLSDIQRLIDLVPETLVTGHDDPIYGTERIAADLGRIRDATRHLHEQTIAGMNAGKSVQQLMQEISLPVELQLAPGRSPVSWTVRAIWEEVSGWFMQQSTTELYGEPQSAIWAELAAMAGGADALAERAKRHAENGEPLKALHFTDIVRRMEPSHCVGREAEIAALEQLIDATGGRNYDELGWLENEIRIARAAMAGTD